MKNAARVEYVKKFTRGPLEGLYYAGYLSFVSEESAREWIDGINRNVKRGALEYRLWFYAVRANGDGVPGELARFMCPSGEVTS